jgi:hypothetical protein
LTAFAAARPGQRGEAGEIGMARDRDAEIDEIRGEIVALETALAAAYGELAVLRATVQGGDAAAALGAMEGMARQLEGSMLRGVVGAEALGRPAAAAGFERRMEQIAHALRNAISFKDR